MPNSAAKSVSGIVVEAGQSGQYSLLTATATSALPVSLTTPLPASALTGMRLVIGVFGHTTVGTITVTGTAVNSGAALSETSISIPLQETPGNVYFYTTTNVFAAVNASGITIGSGLSGGTIVIYGVQAAKRMIVGDVKVDDKRKDYQPIHQRGGVDEIYYNVPLSEEPMLEISTAYYPDDSLFLMLGGYNGATVGTSIPAVPIAVLASTPCVTANTASAALQPTAPGMVLQVTLGGTPATAATISVTGTNLYGETISETIVPNTKVAGVYTSSNVFATIATNGIVYGAFGGACTLVVGAVFGWSQAAAAGPNFNLATFALENYDSVGSFTAPYWLLDEWVIEGGMDKELKVTLKGPCQSIYPVGDPTNANNQITTFAQTLDEVITGWSAVAYLDNVSATPGTTPTLDLVDFKVTCKLGAVMKHTSAWNPPLRKPSRAYLKRRRIEVDVTFDMTNTTFQQEYLNGFRANKRRVLQLQIRGPLMGQVAGVNSYLGTTITIPLRWANDATRDFTKENVDLKLKGIGYYEPALGYSHQLTWFTRLPNW